MVKLDSALLLLLCLMVAACNPREGSGAATESTKVQEVKTSAADQPSVADKSAAAVPAQAPLDVATPVDVDKSAEAVVAAQTVEEKTAAGEAAPAYAEAMLNPDKANLKAPEKYTVRLKTTKGDVIIDVTRAWAPLAADRFFNLVKMGFFTDVAFFRVIEGFMGQAGVHGDPKVNAIWANRGIKDEEPKQSNTRGMVSFAAAGKDSRATQFFINFGDNSRLDHYPPSGFAPFGKVRKMTALDRIYAGYGEGAPMGRGPNQVRMNKEGNAYLAAEFPQLDYIREAMVE